MAKTLIFDINETTLDLSPVRRAVDDHLVEAGGFDVWFPKLLQLSMTSSATNTFVEFGVLARAAFDALATQLDSGVRENAFGDVAAALRSLRAHPDVAHGLTALREAGWRTVALTNSALAVVQDQLTHAGLASLFDHVLSVETVGSYKPSAAPYLHASETVGQEPEDLWMVACHDWDLAGARAVGMSTVFVARPGMVYAPSFPPPDIVVEDFSALAAHVGLVG